jgi:hypothetical protein
MDDCKHQHQKRIAETASGMLAGNVSYIVGARLMVALSFEAGLERDFDILPFVGADSETDALPVEEKIKHLWSSEALEKLRPEIDRAETWARKFLEPHCRSLVARF